MTLAASRLRSRLPDKPWAAALIVAGALISLVIVRLAANDLDPSRFVWAGVGHADPARVPADLYVHRDSAGYDGQFFYRLALDPLTSRRSAYGIQLDIPPYRQQRILYPALVWLVTGGRASLVPWALILVNLAAGIGMAFAAAGLARASGRHAAWGVPLALLPGVAVALSRDTGELVAVACLAAGLLALRHHRFP